MKQNKWALEFIRKDAINEKCPKVKHSMLAILKDQDGKKQLKDEGLKVLVSR